MRIAFLADTLDRQYGGIHIYTKEILRALSKTDDRNEYVVVRSEAGERFGDFEEVVIPYAKWVGYRAWRLWKELPKLVTKKGVDLVVEPAHFGPLNLPKRIKRVTVIHDMTMFLFSDYHLFWSQFLQRKFLPQILKKTHHIITNSENTTKDLNQIFPFTKTKTTTIPLGKNEIFSPQTNTAVLEKYQIQKPYLLFVGTLEPRKNLTTLIEAFNQFKAFTGQPHQLVLVGKKGWKSESIFQAIQYSPFESEILWLDYIDRDDLPVLYSMATVFVYPSHYEGFGLPVLEAMACGTPVITSNVSSLPEVGGNVVLYAAPDVVEEWSEQLKKICLNKSLNANLRQLSLERAAKFNWEKTAKKTQCVFELLNEKQTHTCPQTNPIF